MGRAEELFESINSGQEAAIDRLIADFQSENLWLDFKRSADVGSGIKLHVSDRENFARAISGFGNSDGGVIVWGVDCRRDPATGADIPQGKFPIENPERYVSWLENVVSSCTSPPHTVIEHRAFRLPGTSVGFVATLIPSSMHAPHQCIQPSTDLRYYIRVGSNFTPVPHAVLAGLFGKRPQPLIALKWLGVAATINNQGTINVQTTISLTNGGRSIARDIYLNIWAYHQGKTSHILFGQVNQDRWEVYQLLNLWNVMSSEGARLAPGASAPVGVFEIALGPPFAHGLQYDISCGCDGSESRQILLDIPVNRLNTLYATAKTELEHGQRPGKLIDAILKGT